MTSDLIARSISFYMFAYEFIFAVSLARASPRVHFHKEVPINSSTIKHVARRGGGGGEEGVEGRKGREARDVN